MTQSFIKDPDGELDYTIDWSTWLDGDTLSSSSWDADTGITIDNDTNDTDSATVWLSAGTAGVDYKVTNTVVSSAGVKDDRTITIKVRQR